MRKTIVSTTLRSIAGAMRESATLSLALVVLLLPSAALANADDGSAVPDAAAQAAVALVAGQHGYDVSELTVHSAVAANLPLSGLSAYGFKIAHEEESLAFEVAVDADGAETNLEELVLVEEEMRQQRYGNLEEALSEQLASAGQDEDFEVSLWIHEPFVEPTVFRPDPEDDPDDAAVDAAAERHEAEREALVAAAVQPIVDQLVAEGYEVETDPYVPVVNVRLPASYILGKVTQWGEIQKVTPAVIYEPTLEVQIPTVQSNVVHNMGIDGTGQRVGVIEVGGRINTANPFLPPARVTQDNLFSCVHPHATAVAGIVGSGSLSRLGNAPNTRMWIGGSCFGSSAQIQNRSTAAANWGARAFNLSFGANLLGNVGSLDRYYDSLVLNRWRTVVVANGNSGAGGFTLSPATAYNVISVGSFDDRNTSAWQDDNMSSFSSSVDPNSWIGDREKPEVAAPGSNLNSTTNAFPWTGAVGSGTSYAAPAVTGIAALLMDRHSALRVWPESVKAILMATAEHNIEGAARLSERDGAGGVVADRADDVARRRHGGWSGRYYSCANPNLLNLGTVYLRAGERARVAMAWDNDPNYGLYNIRPGADLDLWVRRPNNSLAAVSVSWDNTYEIVDFVATQTGNHTLQVRKWRCSYTPRWLGWAWHIVE